MTFGQLTLLRPSRWSALLLPPLLAGCIMTTQGPTQAPPKPPPSASTSGAVGGLLPRETLRSVCLAWFNSLPTWQDSDAERTKDEIDRSYAVQEDVCKIFMAD